MRFLLAQGLVQRLDLLLQFSALRCDCCRNAGELGLVFLIQMGKSFTLLLDQLRSFLAIVVGQPLSDLFGKVAGRVHGVPLILRGNLQAPWGNCSAFLFLEHDAQAVQLDGVTQQRQIVVASGQGGVPQVHLVPGNRALATTGEPDWPGAQIRTPSSALGHLLQRYIPAAVGRAAFVEVQIEEHGGTNLQACIDHQIGSAHLLIGEIRHLHQAIEQRFELRVEHLLADAAVFGEEHHGLDLLRLAHRCSPDE